jgi:hypothetical protein
MLLAAVPAAAVLVLGAGAYAALKLAAGGGAVNLNAGLVGWWKLDGNVIDSSSYANNGSLMGGATYGPVNGQG